MTTGLVARLVPELGSATAASGRLAARPAQTLDSGAQAAGLPVAAAVPSADASVADPTATRTAAHASPTRGSVSDHWAASSCSTEAWSGEATTVADVWRPVHPV